jgi:hypothetical protein
MSEACHVIMFLLAALSPAAVSKAAFTIIIDISIVSSRTFNNRACVDKVLV